MTESIQVQHNPSASRFELVSEGFTAVLEYRLDDGIINFTHTGVPGELEGRGIGSQLVRAGLEFARERSLKVIPTCWFVAGYIKRHPEYQSML